MSDRKRLIFILLIFFLVTGTGVTIFMLSGDQRGTESDRLQPQPSFEERRVSVKQGKKLYRRYCVTCHGKQGHGDGPASEHLSRAPLNFHSDTAVQFTDRELFDRISHGKVGAGMPAWESQLSRRERWQIVHYLNSAFIESTVDSPSIR